MKIQENMNSVWRLETAYDTGSVKTVPQSQSQTESVYSQSGAVYEKTEALGFEYTTYNADGTVNQTGRQIF